MLTPVTRCAPWRRRPIHPLPDAAPPAPTKRSCGVDEAVNAMPPPEFVHRLAQPVAGRAQIGIFQRVVLPHRRRRPDASRRQPARRRHQEHPAWRWRGQGHRLSASTARSGLTGAVSCTGATALPATDRRSTTSLPPSIRADSRSSSSSGSFISQCATRRSSSACGPPPWWPRDHSQIWSDSSSADTALVHMVQHQQRRAVGPGHQHLALHVLAGDRAVPGPPVRRVRAGRQPGRPSVTGWRAPRSVIAGAERAVDHAIGAQRPRGPAGRRPAASGRGCAGDGELRARASAAAPPPCAHVVGDVAQIERAAGCRGR